VSSLISRLRSIYEKAASRLYPFDENRVPSEASPGIHRVLVKEVNWLGDLVLSLPALRALRSAFATAKVSVLVREDLAGFFDGMEWVDEVIPYRMRPGLHRWADQRKIIGTVRARGFDLAVIFPKSLI
jgi:heptosyltransferase-2